MRWTFGGRRPRFLLRSRCALGCDGRGTTGYARQVRNTEVLVPNKPSSDARIFFILHPATSRLRRKWPLGGVAADVEPRTLYPDMSDNKDDKPATQGRPAVATLLVIVLLTASAVRLVNFIQLRDSSVLHTYLWDDSDMGFFLRWSRDIVGGNVIGDPRPVPWHVPYQNVTRQAHVLHGDPRPWTEEIGLKILNDWTGGKRFIQEPLYPYLLAGIYDLFGLGAWPVLIMQALCGVGIACILFFVGVIVFGRWTGFIAGMLAALNLPLILYESTLLRQALVTFLILLTTVVVMLAGQHPRLNRWWILSGLAGGLSLSAFSGVLPVLAGFVAWLIWSARKSDVAYTKPLCLMATAFLVILAPIFVRNAIVGIAPWSLSGMAAANYVATNCGDCFAWGGYTISGYLPEILNRNGNQLLPAALDAIQTHDSALAWMGFMGRRILGVLNNTEYPNNVSLAYYMLHAGLLGRIGIGFGLILPLSVAGLILLRKQHGLIVPILIVAAMFLFICVVFLNIPRFRVSVALALIPLAAYGIVGTWELLRSGRYREAVPVVIAAGLGLFLGFLPWAPGRPQIKDTYYIVGNDIAKRFITERLETGDVQGAQRVLEKHLATEPSELLQYAQGSGHTIPPPDVAGLAGAFHSLHRDGARVSDAQGDSEGATKFMHEANRLSELSTRYNELVRWHLEQLGADAPVGK